MDVLRKNLIFAWTQTYHLTVRIGQWSRKYSIGMMNAPAAAAQEYNQLWWNAAATHVSNCVENEAQLNSNTHKTKVTRKGLN